MSAERTPGELEDQSPSEREVSKCERGASRPDRLAARLGGAGVGVAPSGLAEERT
jgi:hypothetical protein